MSLPSRALGPVGGLILLVALVVSSCGPFGSNLKLVAPKASYQTGRQAGASATDLLTSKYFRSLVVEIQAARGFAPSPESLLRLREFLEQRLDKPGGVTVTSVRELPASAQAPNYTVAEARALESKYRQNLPNSDQFALYVLFLDGASADAASNASTKLIAQAYGNTSIVVFENTLRTEVAARSGVPIWIAEAAYVEHEVGHLLGLVSTQAASHADVAHPGHCRVGNCLMNSHGDTTELLDQLASSAVPAVTSVPALDPECLKDLSALSK